MVKILAFAGSSRKQSLNKKLLQIGVAGVEAAGAKVTRIDLGDFDMPLMNQDLEREAGMPEKAGEFKNLMLEHDGFLIASPEYNSAFSPLLKNSFDWASRSESDDEPGLVAFRGKTAGLLATSPGGLGGSRGLVMLRMMLANLGVYVLPDQITVPNGSKAFDDDGSMIDQSLEARIHAMAEKFVQFTEKLR